MQSPWMNLYEEKRYKHYNPWVKQVPSSCDVLFDESASWYSLLTLTHEDSVPNSKNEDREASTIVDKEEIGIPESPISFRRSGPNEVLTRNG